MAIAHAVSGEVVDLLAPGGVTTPDKTLALFKAKDLEVMRIVLPAGKRVPDHSVPGSITVQCLGGQVELFLPHQTAVLSAGQFAYVGGGVPHGLHALKDSDLLVTIAISGNGNTSTTTG
ncbi:cupin domain-containing protein [Variovorax sp. OV329]|uniref:cupin domain-containing protein n=1 Tax=Variovorax sp. OV329 TaxID=1882825 RepID=UPI0008EC9EE9|nr:cupin domain-containing protein [Variovorax sp. OV329]SFN10072.1 Cupin domain protein [Variovorax sp. OV329]